MRKPPALTLYRSKRDFSKTDEPSGLSKTTSSARLRFVVQKHAARRLHYDLRLELNGSFKSWAVTRGPSLDPKDKRLAVEVEDHPLDYGDFEGTIPQGEYGGGTVQLWDRGYWVPEGPKSPQDALKSGDLKFTLHGARLHGSWVLVRMRSDRNGGKRTNWLLIKHKDDDARPGDADGLLEADASVASERTLDEIAAGTGRRSLPFMLATAAPASADAVWGSKKTRNEPAALPAPTSAPMANRGTTRAAVRGAGGGASPRGKPLRAAKMPAFVDPQLTKLVDQPPEGDTWGHEVKFDGYRMQLRLLQGRATLRTRSGLDWTDRFAAIAQDCGALPDCMIDGEAVVLDEHGLPDFGALQAALSDGRSDALIFFAFDLLFEGRNDLRALPLEDRKARLEALLDAHGGGSRLRYVSHLISNAKHVYSSACKMGLEGIVSKQLDAPYRSGRSGSWTKAKCRAGQEVVIGGWTTEGGAVRSLLAGVYRGNELGYVGRIGTGYGRKADEQLLPKLKQWTREESPFRGAGAPRKEKNIRWLAPKLVAEIEFAGWTGTGMIRQAAFKGLRLDKPTRQVVAEKAAAPTPEPGGKAKPTIEQKTRAKQLPPEAVASKITGSLSVLGVTISKPNKALWPDAGDGVPVTKADLASYYEQIGDWMLPHLAGRPCSLVRVPDGVGGEQFFQRHAMAGGSPLLTLVKVKGDKAPYLQVDRVEALIAVAQIGALELHPWNCAPGDPEVAGRLVFDLDPAPDVKFEAVITAALEVRKRLEAAGLETFCKTTGGKGLHVVTPLTAGQGAVAWDAAKNFAHMICAQMVADSPAKYLDTMSKIRRTGKIFLDYLRNDRTATAVAVLSPRARDGAPVSMPVEWKDVRPGLDPKKFTLRSSPALLRRSKAWAGYAAAARSLADAIRFVTRAPPGVRRK